MELAALIGLPVGILLRRTWAPLLPLTLLVALNPPGAGFAGAIVAFLIVAPFAGSQHLHRRRGGQAAAARWRSRRMLVLGPLDAGWITCET